MTYYVKSQPGCEKVEFDRERVIKEVGKRRTRARKKPTSVALDPETIEALQREAKAKGVPYQVLMRMYILEGLKRSKRKAL